MLSLTSIAEGEEKDGPDEDPDVSTSSHRSLGEKKRVVFRWRCLWSSSALSSSGYQCMASALVHTTGVLSVHSAWVIMLS